MMARRSLRVVGRILLILVVLLLLGAVVLWTQRRPIAIDAIDRALADRGVRAEYRISELGFRRQRLADVRIGDPANPDLVARWAELELGYGLNGVIVKKITAQGVRLRGRIVDGKLSLGEIDRLMPPPSDAPFTLPDFDTELSDARMRLDTPVGAFGITLDGRGRLSNGFSGKLAAVGRNLTIGGCIVDRATAYVNLAVADRAPTLDGPVRVSGVHCLNQGIRLSSAGAALDVRLNEALDHWRGGARIEMARFVRGTTSLSGVIGQVGFDGGAAGTRGQATLDADLVEVSGASMRDTTIDGRYLVGPDGMIRLAGQAGFRRARADDATLAAIDGVAASGRATPLAPLSLALGRAVGAAARNADVRARITLVHRAGQGGLRIGSLEGNAASGAEITLSGGSGITYYWPTAAARIDGDLATTGGGLPDARIRLRQPSVTAPIEGEGRIEPYQAGGARIALGPLSFGAARGGGTRFSTGVTLDGPLGDGRVDGLAMPVVGRFDSRGGFRLGEGCQPLGFAALAVAGMRLGDSRLRLCPIDGGALVWRNAGGALRGGAAINGPRLTGQVGQSPLTLAARDLRVELGRTGFLANELSVRLGTPDSQTRLDVIKLDGRVTPAGLAGRFEEAEGKIGAVPLILSKASGDWTLAGGRLDLAGGLTVADEATERRFLPMISDDVRLRLVDGVITASGHLREPRTGTNVASVDIVHDLSNTTGQAKLVVDGLTFTERFQPDALTPLTLGVVANVAGTVNGRGDIRWTAEGVKSDGLFSTDTMDFAAAFGPVNRLKGTIRFSDLLGMETLPGQEVTIGEINTGIAVLDGVVNYQLLPGQRIKVEGGRWPFSGGELTLEETTFDMSEAAERRLTFTVVGLDAARFIQQLEFENIAATGIFDGTMPMIFDKDGGRIEGGRLVARRGGGTLAYVGELSNADLGMFAKLAFDALKKLKYDNLSIQMNGPLDGELVSKVVFGGINEEPLEGEKKSPFVKSFIGLPFKFNITVTAPFRGLINSAQSFVDPSGLIRNSLPETETPAEPVIQPSASETVQ